MSINWVADPVSPFLQESEPNFFAFKIRFPAKWITFVTNGKFFLILNPIYTNRNHKFHTQ